MNKPDFFSDIQNKVSQIFEHSPVAEIEKNIKSILHQGFSKLDLITREEFDIQTKVLAKTRAKLETLEAHLTEIEAQLRVHTNK